MVPARRDEMMPLAARSESANEDCVGVFESVAERGEEGRDEPAHLAMAAGRRRRTEVSSRSLDERGLQGGD